MMGHPCYSANKNNLARFHPVHVEPRAGPKSSRIADRNRNLPRAVELYTINKYMPRDVSNEFPCFAAIFHLLDWFARKGLVGRG